MSKSISVAVAKYNRGLTLYEYHINSGELAELQEHLEVDSAINISLVENGIRRENSPLIPSNLTQEDFDWLASCDAPHPRWLFINAYSNEIIEFEREEIKSIEESIYDEEDSKRYSPFDMRIKDAPATEGFWGANLANDWLVQKPVHANLFAPLANTFTKTLNRLPNVITELLIQKRLLYPRRIKLQQTPHYTYGRGELKRAQINELVHYEIYSFLIYEHPELVQAEPAENSIPTTPISYGWIADTENKILVAVESVLAPSVSKENIKEHITRLNSFLPQSLKSNYRGESVLPLEYLCGFLSDFRTSDSAFLEHCTTEYNDLPASAVRENVEIINTFLHFCGRESISSNI